MSKYIISYFLLFLGFVATAQEKQNKNKIVTADSTIIKEKYGLRLGADLGRLAGSFLNDNYQGFELLGDYRVSQKYYLAGEIGNEKKTIEDDQINFTANGSYIKLGFDYNAYDNWLQMQNSVHIGLRYGFSTFSQTVNNYDILNRNRLFQEDTFVENEIEHNGLNAHWLEAVAGIKAELAANIFIGFSLRLSRLVSNKQDDNFTNLWIPGFNKVTDGSSFGVGFNYSISYLVPLYKKDKIIKPKEEEIDN